MEIPWQVRNRGLARWDACVKGAQESQGQAVAVVVLSGTFRHLVGTCLRWILEKT